jgi:hypothetical protein
MKEPGLTWGGPVGRRLLATGLQAGTARTAQGTTCTAAACAAAELGTAQQASAATARSGGRLSQRRAVTGTPPAVC